MGFASCYAASEKYVGLTLDILNSRLFKGWIKNDDRKGVDCIHPLFLGGCEVKADFRAHKTGNVFIETECSGNPSGCYKYDDMVFWAQWVDDTKEMLLLDIRVLRTRMQDVGRKLSRVGDGNANGYLVKLDWMREIALINLIADDYVL